MKQIFVMGLAVTAMVVAGCSKAESDVATTSRYIQATSAIDGVLAKAPIDGEGAAISDVAFVRVDDAPSKETTITFAAATPFSGSRVVGGAIIFGTAQEYEQGEDKTAYLLGYRPAVDLVAGKVTWILDGMTDVMTTNVWSAGQLSAPITTGMTFKHELARLEVICVAQTDIAQSVIDVMWGDIEYVKLKGALPSVELDLATKTMALTGDPIDFLLVNAGYTAAFAPMAIPGAGSTVITAAAMVAPIDAGTITLLVKTENLTEKEIAVTLTGKLERAKTHKVTLTFKANGKDIESKTSTIEGWSFGTSGSNDVVEPVIP